MVTVTTTPSVASAGQHRGALFDSWLPMPHTTHRSPTFEIGCTTWAWCPTTRSTAPGTAASASATACCASTTSWWYSLPQCSETTTSSAPAARAACGVGQDQRRVDLVDEPLLAGRPHEAVEPVGVGQLGDARSRRRRRAPGGRSPPATVPSRRAADRPRRARRASPPPPAPRSRARGSTPPSSRRTRPRPGRVASSAAPGTAGSSTAPSPGRARVTSRWQIARSAAESCGRDRRQHRREVVARRRCRRPSTRPSG